jgi:hypothetical protein
MPNPCMEAFVIAHWNLLKVVLMGFEVVVKLIAW